MTTYTAIDLSKLPAPSVVEALDFDTILASYLTKLVEMDATYTALLPSDPVYKILSAVAYRELVLRQNANDQARAVMIAYAEGDDLDNLVALLGIERFTLDPGDASKSIAPTMESDDDLRARAVLTPEGYSVAGPEGAYESLAINASSQVLDARATSPAPCEVTVTVLARTGTGVPDQALLDTVKAAVSADTARPMTDLVTVAGANIVNFTVEGTRYTYAGPDPAVMLAASDQSLATYLTSCHKLDIDVTMAGLHAAIMVAGMQNVVLTSPAADITIDDAQAESGIWGYPYGRDRGNDPNTLRYSPCTIALARDAVLRRGPKKTR